MTKRFGFFDRLEERCVLSTLRVAAWNTFNLPNVTADAANYDTVLATIEAKEVQGTAKRLDILTVVETDPLSIDLLTSIFDDRYGPGTYASVVSQVDGGGDATGFVYGASTISLLASVEVPGSLTHRILRGAFRPLGTLGESDLYVYAVHLKSGTGSANAAARANEMQFLRQDAESLGEGKHVLFAGDFNLQSSQEATWSLLAAPGFAQAFDVAHAPGDWAGDSSFQSLHTHSTQDMDGRFDFQFVSGELLDNAGLDYVDGSFQVFGNNGTHGLSNAIDAGTGASSSVLAALRNASDHLPVMADYSFVPSVPVIVSQSGGRTEVFEGGNGDTYSLVLGSVPAAEVVVRVQSSAALRLGTTPSTTLELRFTPQNALTPQTIVVTAPDNAIYQGVRYATVSNAVFSTDPLFNSYPALDVDVTIFDDDVPNLVINEVDSDTPGADAREFVELFDGGVGGFPLDGYVMVFWNGGLTGPFATFDLDGYRTNHHGFFVAGNPLVTNVDLTFANGILQNGPDAVALYRAESTQLHLLTLNALVDAIVYGTNDPDDVSLLSLLLPGQPQVNESQHGSSDLHSMQRVPDGGLARATHSYEVKPPTPGFRNAASSGDFDSNGMYDCLDIDSLVTRVAESRSNSTFDLNADGILDLMDVQQWLNFASAANLPAHGAYRFGDANLDGVVDGSDFGRWNGNKFTTDAGWCGGDFNADGAVDGSDFAVWNANKFTSSDRPELRAPAVIEGKAMVTETQVLALGFSLGAPESAGSQRLSNLRRHAWMPWHREWTPARNADQTVLIELAWQWDPGNDVSGTPRKSSR